MVQTFTCPHCREELELPPDHEDGLTCPACGKDFDVADERPDLLPMRRCSRGVLDSFVAAPSATTYRPLGAWTVALWIALAVEVLLRMCFLMNGYLPIDVFTNSRNLQLFFGGCFMVASTVSFLLLVIWFYFAYANVEALGAGTTRFARFWAIVGWIVPIFNLFRPAQIAQEIFGKSDEHYVAGSPSFAKSGLIAGWWTALLFQWLFGLLTTLRAATNSSVSTRSVVVLQIVGIAATVLLMGVIGRIDTRQTERAAARRLWSGWR